MTAICWFAFDFIMMRVERGDRIMQSTKMRFNKILSGTIFALSKIQIEWSTPYSTTAICVLDLFGKLGMKIKTYSVLRHTCSSWFWKLKIRFLVNNMPKIAKSFFSQRQENIVCIRDFSWFTLLLLLFIWIGTYQILFFH